MALPPSVRKDVALRLLDSIEVADQESVDEAWSAEIESRIDDILSGKVEMIHHEVVLAESAERRAARQAARQAAVTLRIDWHPAAQAEFNADIGWYDGRELVWEAAEDEVLGAVDECADTPALGGSGRAGPVNPWSDPRASRTSLIASSTQ